MSIDVIDLRDFYSQRLGIVARRLINRGIRARWPEAEGQRVLGIGYPTPYLGLFRNSSERCIAFMPAAQGVLKWPTSRPTLAALVDEFSLPLPNSAVDRILLVHALEMCDDPEGLLREVWRVLAPSGRMMAVVPNRRGVWTRTDNTPFGHGRPYSRSQITELLRQTWFTPIGWGEALFVPPVGAGWFLRSAMAWERVGAAISIPFAGVHIVEATKQVYRAIPRTPRAHAPHTGAAAGIGAVVIPARPARSARERAGLAIVAGIEIVAGSSGRRSHALWTRPMRATATARKAFALAFPAITVEAAVDLRLRSGDEGGQAIDAAIVRHRRLRRLILRLVALALLAMFARLVLMLTRLILLMVALAGVAGERLLLLRHESRLLAEARKALILLAILRDHVGIRPGLLRLILAELLLGCCNQAEVMFGVLIVVFRGDRIAGRARVTRQLHIFFSDVRCRATDFNVWSV